jgi:myosin heavy subunit
MQLVLHGHKDLSFAKLSTMSFDVDPASIVLRDELLENARAVELVNDEFTQNLALNVLRDIKAKTKQCEDVRVELKAPILELGRKVDQAAKDYCTSLKEEQGRLERMNNAYVDAQLQKEREAKAAQEAELARLETERRKLEQAAASTGDTKQLEQIQAKTEQVYQREAAVLTAPVAAPTPTGTKVKMTWTYQVENIRELAKARPELVDMKPSHSAILKALKAGDRTLPGVTGIREVPDMKY